MNLVNNNKKKIQFFLIHFQDGILLSSTGYGNTVYWQEDEQSKEHEGPLFFFGTVNGRDLKQTVSWVSWILRNKLGMFYPYNMAFQWKRIRMLFLYSFVYS